MEEAPELHSRQVATCKIGFVVCKIGGVVCKTEVVKCVTEVVKCKTEEIVVKCVTEVVKCKTEVIEHKTGTSLAWTRVSTEAGASQVKETIEIIPGAMLSIAWIIL